MHYFNFHHHQFGEKFGIYNLEFNEKIPENFFSVGLHPKFIDENWKKYFSWVAEIAKHENCVAIGECGLDGRIIMGNSLQKIVFEKHIALANFIKKPIIIHNVKRFSEIISLKKTAKTPMIIHGYNKRESVGNELLKHDFYLSFGKSVLQNVNLQEYVKKVPIEKLFLETDDADVDISRIYALVSSLKKCSEKELIHQIKKNLESIGITI